jgi:hypothetical protein
MFSTESIRVFLKLVDSETGELFTESYSRNGWYPLELVGGSKLFSGLFERPAEDPEPTQKPKLDLDLDDKGFSQGDTIGRQKLKQFSKLDLDEMKRLVREALQKELQRR